MQEEVKLSQHDLLLRPGQFALRDSGLSP